MMHVVVQLIDVTFFLQKELIEFIFRLYRGTATLEYRDDLNLK